MTRLRLLVNLFCVLVVLAALATAAVVVVQGQIGRQGVDALFLVLVCLLIAFGFALSPVQAWREGQFQELLKRKKKNKPGADKDLPDTVREQPPGGQEASVGK